MKEPNLNQSEISVKTIKEIQRRLTGRIEPHSNHKLFEVHLTTGKIILAEFERILHWEQKPKKTVLVKKDCVYVSAMNIKNAIKHFNNKSNGSKF